MLALFMICGTQVDTVKQNKQAYAKTVNHLKGEKKMKKNMVVGIALAMGMLSVGAISASAAGSCCIDGKCTDKQVVQQFLQETAGLGSALKAKDLELREVYGYDSIDIRKVNELEVEIKELKGKIKVVGEKYDIKSCCLG
jgi:peptidoglycan hydrolase CwlO-like protein